jgi:hypothetical protein
MAPRSSKNKSTTEKGGIAPIQTTTGRQRTQSTKQQLLRKSCILWLCLFKLTLPPVEQEKANKIKATKDKALQEAVRSHQRQEEILGFRKIPVRPPPQGKPII